MTISLKYLYKLWKFVFYVLKNYPLIITSTVSSFLVFWYWSVFFGHKNCSRIIFSKEFVYTGLPFILAIVFLWKYPTWFIKPPKDKIVISTANFIGGKWFKEALEKEWEPYQSLCPEIEFRPGQIIETITNNEQAKKAGKKRGIHFVVYGDIEESNNFANITTKILMTTPPRSDENRKFLQEIGAGLDVEEFSEFKIQSKLDRNNIKQFDERKKIVKEIINKLLKSQYHFLLSRRRIDSFATSNFTHSETGTYFYIGSNFCNKFYFSNESNSVVLWGIVDNNGNHSINGELFDSDGNLGATIKNNLPEEKNGCELIKNNDGYKIIDKYGRTLFQYIIEKDLRTFTNEVMRRLKELNISRNILEYVKRDIHNAKIITITGEFYTPKGLLGVIVDEEKTYQYMGLTLDLGEIRMGGNSQKGG